jgi:hypothetical protein
VRARTRTILGTIVATIAMTALASAAYGAGNGNGNGNANGNSAAAGEPAAAAASPGNSGDAPGQAAKPEHGNPNPGNPGHDPSVASQHQQSATSDKGGGGHGASQTPTQGNPANPAGSAGLKPTNSTSHNVSAAASSTSTKRYGNGKTAGQIAMHYGAPGSTMLYGPGNSQPHKVSGCAHPAHGKGGGFDVHALKAHSRQAGCASQQPPAVEGGVTPTLHRTNVSDPAVSVVTPAAGSSGSSSAESKPKSRAEGASDPGTGGLTAVGTVGAGTLPFTGFPLWIVALFSLGLAALGLTLRRQARAEA